MQFLYMATFFRYNSINEDNQSLNGKQIQVPKNIINVLKQNNNMINTRYNSLGNGEYHKLDGYKRNQRITNDDYNTRKKNNEDAGIISYNDLVKWKHDFDSMPKSEDNVSYQLNGGKEAESFVQNTLNHMRNAVASSNAKKKSDNIKKNQVKTFNKPTDTIKIDNNDVHIKENYNIMDFINIDELVENIINGIIINRNNH